MTPNAATSTWCRRCARCWTNVARSPTAARARESLITYVKDRPGHDRRYAIDASKLQTELGWMPTVTFEQGMARTVDWTLANQPWVQRVLDGSYRLERIGGAA